MKKKSLLHLFLFVLFLLSFSMLTSSLFADDTYVGVHVYVVANRNDAGTGSGTSHSRYIADFENLVLDLKDAGINTIVFGMACMKYHYQCDTALAALNYSATAGFTYSEIQELAEIARDNDMKIVVSQKALTHQENNAISYAYPGYMVTEAAWEVGKVYKNKRMVEHNGVTYQCFIAHRSTTALEPGIAGTEAYWKVKARSTRNPFDEDGEDLTFAIIDELIAAFTVDGQKPDAFNIECDEGFSWLNIDLTDSRNVNNLDYAETYAMAVNNLYTHITTYHSGMDVMMWGDMLDPVTNGAAFQTTAAVDLISDNIIILDWRYTLYADRFDFKTGLFPSVQEFTDKGFRVIPASWYSPDATAALVWTGNMAEAGGGTILGHIYAPWYPVVPYLSWAFDNPNDPSLHEWIVGAYESIVNTIDDIGATQCAGTDTSYGTYPDCGNCNESDGLYGAEYRDYYLGTSGVTYNTASLPLEPISYWDFEGDANDRSGNNDGTLTNGASIITDSKRGQVLCLDGVNDYVLVGNNTSLDMNGNLTLSCWFKLDGEIDDFDDRVALAGKHYLEYELLIDEYGRLTGFSSDGTSSGYESGASYNPTRYWEPGKWYHVAWVLDGYHNNLYVNGELVGIYDKKLYEGTLSGTHNFEIGRRSGSNYYMDGCMDDVMLFDEALAPAEVKFLYLAQEISNPIAYWDFEGNADDRVGSNNGTLSNGASIDEDIERFNEDVLVLDGTDDGVSCGNSTEFMLTGSRTISAWINPDVTKADYMMITGKYIWNYSMSVYNGRFRAYMNATNTAATSLSSTANIVPGEWQHVAMTFDIDGDKKIHLYVNGEEVSYSSQTAMVGTPVNSSTANFTIGADYNLSRYNFDGKIDNVKVFDYALNSDQIAVQYQLGESSLLYRDLLRQHQVEESICLDVNLNEGTGTTVDDASDNENDGIVCGNNWSWVSGIAGNALDFYGTDADAYINFGTPASLELTGSRSISAWIKPDSNNGTYNFIAGKYAWGSSLFTHDGKLKGYVAGTVSHGASYSTAVITIGEWQHVAMTFDIDGDKKVHLYRNGIELEYSSQATFSGSTIDNSAKRFTIGADFFPRYFFDGKIDQVKLFSKALTDREVIYYYLNNDI